MWQILLAIIASASTQYAAEPPKTYESHKGYEVNKGYDTQVAYHVPKYEAVYETPLYLGPYTGHNQPPYYSDLQHGPQPHLPKYNKYPDPYEADLKTELQLQAPYTKLYESHKGYDTQKGYTAEIHYAPYGISPQIYAVNGKSQSKST